MDPQLATDLDWRQLQYPCTVEPKIDGCRCLVVIDEAGGVHPFSRRGAEWTAIAPALRNLARFPGVTFDGEIVVAGSWGKTNGAIHRRALSPAELASVVFHAFDLPSHDGPQAGRRAALVDLLATLPATSAIRVVPSVPCADRTTVEVEYARIVAEGGEGIVAKAPGAAYTPGRAGTWGKLKPQPTKDVFRGGRCLELRGGRVYRVRADKVA